jgi:hypothetical protein
MSPADRDLLLRVYDAFNARAIDAVLAAMHPDVDWPNGMEGGRIHGRRAVRDYWVRQWRVIDPHVEPRSFSLEDAGRYAVEVHQLVRDLSGRVIGDQMVRHVYEIRDGLIRRMDVVRP